MAYYTSDKARGAEDGMSSEEASRRVNDWAAKSSLNRDNELFDAISEEQDGNTIDHPNSNDIRNERSSSDKTQELNNQILENKLNGGTRSSDGGAKGRDSSNSEVGNRDNSTSHVKSKEVAHNNSKKKTQLSTSASSNTDHISSKNIGHYVLGKWISLNYT